MRDAFSRTLVELARADRNVLLLTGDHGYALFDEFRRACPDQYINAGIAEQNMVGMAAGLARAGFRPIVYGLSAFIPVRVLEQIKLDVAHDKLPVIFIGDGAGFVYSHLGTSHQSTEDIACTRAVPDLQVYSPADAFEMTMCLRAAYQGRTSVYLRMGKSDRGTVHENMPEVPVGRLLGLRAGSEGGVAFIATGSLVRSAMDIAQSTYPEASVWTAPYIKPIDVAQVVDICRSSRAVVTFEEHSIHGGLGSMVAEVASEHAPVRILRVGVRDRFSEHCGSYDYLLHEHGLDQVSIKRQLTAYLSISA
ncbi:transketolase family protein [Leeia sp.]|uniref:transketolase family protein n=1 Tax=Leeia sp. TaxID=2884678 RepID=UPI0035B4D0FD